MQTAQQAEAATMTAVGAKFDGVMSEIDAAVSAASAKGKKYTRFFLSKNPYGDAKPDTFVEFSQSLPAYLKSLGYDAELQAISDGEDSTKWYLFVGWDIENQKERNRSRNGCDAQPAMTSRF